MKRPLPILVGLLWMSCGECYDAYYTCSKPMRSAKAKALYPCDLTSQTWCTIPGSYYPWRAVRRFVYENHGLMRRMYGDERHISVLRSEIDSNDIDYLDSGWTHDLNKYKLTKDQLHRDKLPPSTSHTTTPTTTPLVNETTPTASTETTTTQEETSTVDDFTTTDSTTTEDMTVTTTTQRLDEKTKPIIYQDTVEKPSPTTTESQILFKSKGVNACPVKEEVVAPFWANNTRGEVLALLNLYPFEQYVHWERCTFENKQMFCRTGCRCEQQYRLHRLLAYDPTNDCRGIFSDWFRFPSCCVCRCYDLPSDIRLTSRSPRNTVNATDTGNQN